MKHVLITALIAVTALAGIARAEPPVDAEPAVTLLAGPETFRAPRNIGEPAYEMTYSSVRIGDDDTVLPPANITAFSYVQPAPTADRPIIFAFNGGPGSASVWLHMSAWGPKRLDTPGGPDTYRPPPYPLQDNPNFLIDAADLVFVDPVGTGLSRGETRQGQRKYYDMRRDARAACEFIQTWLEASDRESAPVFLAGESYGSLRVAGIAAHPTCKPLRPQLKGLLLISGLLDMRAHPAARTVTSAVGQFPTHAAISWYHNKVDRAAWDNDFTAFLEDARQAARRYIAPAQMAGNALTREERTAMGEALAPFSVWSASRLASRPLPLNLSQNWPQSFTKVRHTGIYDGRFVSSLRLKERNGPLPGLSMDAIGDVFEDALREHLAAALSYDLPYKYIVMQSGGTRTWWSYEYSRAFSFGGGTNMAALLGHELRRNALGRHAFDPQFKLFIASGLHDQATPFHALELALNQARYGAHRYEIHLYEGGHMMYLNEDVGVKLAGDVRAFIAAQMQPPPTLTAP